MPSLSRSASPTGSVSSTSFWLGLCLAGGAIALSVVGFSHESRDDSETDLPTTFKSRPLPGPPGLVHARQNSSGPLIDSFEYPRNLHDFVVVNHQGRWVYRIRATTNGDEILIDYETGKLLSVQEQSGKLATPVAPPMVMVETTVNS